MLPQACLPATLEQALTFYTLDFSDRTCEQVTNLDKAIDLVVDYLNQGEHGWEADDFTQVYVNQAERDATVLAVRGSKVLIEYEMPRGTTAMLVMDGRFGDLRGRSNVAYSTIPQYWIDAMHKAGTEWRGFGQRRRPGNAFPMPE